MHRHCRLHRGARHCRVGHDYHLLRLVIHGELCNTAMEAIVDLATQELHPLAKRAKDIAAASVYVLSITAAIVGLLVFAHSLGFI